MEGIERLASGSHDRLSRQRISRADHTRAGSAQRAERNLLCLVVARSPIWLSISAQKAVARSWRDCTQGFLPQKKFIVFPTNRWSTADPCIGMLRAYGSKCVAPLQS